MDEDISYSTLVFRNGAPPPRNQNEEVTIYSAIKTTEATEPRKKEEVTLYSGIKTAEPLTTKQKQNEDLTVSSGVKREEPATPATQALKAEEAAKFQSRLLLVCLGILCVLVASVIVIIICFTMVMKEQEANSSDLMAKNQQLIVEKRVLENQTEELTVQRQILENQTKELIVENKLLVNQTEQLITEKRVLENHTEQLIVEKRVLENHTEQLIVEKRVLENHTEQLIVEKRVLENHTEQLIVEKRVLENQTEQLSKDRENLKRSLRTISKFDNFPVQNYCSGKNCQPCQKDWIQYQNKCYYFHNNKYNWKTWTKSRRYCQDRAADLVVIDDLDEQKFINKNIEYYYDEYHGYWLGLYKNNNNWVWVDGRTDTLQYWKQKVDDSQSFALMIPGLNDTENWSKNKENFLNIFICEQEVVTWPN